MTQLRLFGPTSWTHPPPHANTPTSRAAANRAAPQHATNKQRVHAYLLDRWDGATDEEIADALGIRTQSEVPARNQLVKDKCVRDTGRVRDVRSEVKAVVWEYCGAMKR